MRDTLLKWWGGHSYTNPWLILTIVILVTVAAFWVSPQLRMTTRWVDMMPEHDPKTIEFNKILDKYASASNVVIVVKGDEKRIKAYADSLAPKIEALTDIVKRVEYTVEEQYLARHGFMLTEESDLIDAVDMYNDLNLLPFLTAINDNFESEYISDDESLSNREKEDRAILFLDGLEYWLKTMLVYDTANAVPDSAAALTAVDRLLIGDPYFINSDKNMLLLFVHPTFPVTETNRSIDCVNRIEEIMNGMNGDFPGIDAGLTGTLTLVRDEMRAMNNDTMVTTIIAFFLILVLFIFSFRAIAAPLLAGITLAVGLVWAAIFAAVTVTTLNLMTSMFAVILIGLGIDFSIHIISIFTEFRGMGISGEDAMRKTLSRTGPGVMTGGFTTACAFLVLMISDSRGMSEFGLVAGGGVIFCMLAGMIVLPALLALHDRWRVRRGKEVNSGSAIDFKMMEAAARGINRRPKLYLAAGIVLTGITIVLAFNLTFDYNYLNIEPEGLRSIELQDDMIDAFDLSPDFVLVSADNVDQARNMAEKAKEYESVAMVSSISEYLPSQKQQEKRRPYIRTIQDRLSNMPDKQPLALSDTAQLISEIDRLGMNIIELADMAFLGGQDRVDHRATMIVGKAGDSSDYNLVRHVISEIQAAPERAVTRLNRFQSIYRDSMQALALQMANDDDITLATIPSSIVDEYADSSGEHYLVTIYPQEQVWDFEFLSMFSEQMHEVSPRVTGTPPLFLRMMSLVGSDGLNGTLLAIAVVFILLLIDLKSFRFAILAMLPLILGSVWMMGLLKLFGRQLTFVNVMAIPLIVGIGIDDGVHVLHRYRREGPESIIKVMRSTGRAVLITSVTTMLAFGSLIFATYRGLGSMGILLFIGVGACFAATFVMLTSIISLSKRE